MMGKNKVRLRYQQMRFLILKQEYTVRRKQQDGDDMARTVGIGLQDFEKIRRERIFLVDKTMFIKEWWEEKDDVTLIARPRRFGKTLTLSMIEQFFSVNYAGTDIFRGMNIWNEEKYREIQGTYPVISLSFSGIKESSFKSAKKKICKTIQLLYRKYHFLLNGDILTEDEKKDFMSVSSEMEDYEASLTLQQLSGYLYRYYKKKVIILLDEYDTPMQEAYVGGFWQELTLFVRNLFNETFKNNPYMERAIMTGITRVSKESIFSDLNNLVVITTTSPQYADAFGFTEAEVEAALREYGLYDRKTEVRQWYDGFRFGNQEDIYNPWSIINYLKNGTAAPYWANTSSNRLISSLLQKGTGQVKESFEKLLAGGTIVTEVEEQIVYDRLDADESAIWSLLLASGYLKVCKTKEEKSDYGRWKRNYTLEITNYEVKVMFQSMVKEWFSVTAANYNGFIKALLADDADVMNAYMNRIALATFSFFDSGSHSSAASEPERFYHGFVLGMIVELEEQYIITSNRESGFGRYDVMLEPRNRNNNAIIMEFKVQGGREKDLSDTAQAALDQIEEKDYASVLTARGIARARIREYGFAFCGKKVLIVGRSCSK